MTKNSVRHTSHLRNHVSYDCHLWCTCVKYNISIRFFQFFKFLIFWVVSGAKVLKMVQNDNKLCPSHSISQEPYIIWLSFMVHLCKMIISPAGSFSFFQDFDSPGVFLILKFDFPGCPVAERAKNCPKWQKFLSVVPYILGTTYHMIFIYGAHVFIEG